MARFLKQVISSEKGQALPIVLVLLILGGLTITPSLGYAYTNLNSSRILGEGVKGVYAADAGVEDALWCLGHGIPPSQQLPENINQMEVTIQTEDKGTYTLSQHSDYLDVDGEVVWDEIVEAYKYTITVIWQPGSGTPEVKLGEVKARLPIGYSYQSGSAASFAENLSSDEPDETVDTQGAYLLNWEFKSPRPWVTENEPVRTQIFYITGEGSQVNNYTTWVVASRSDIGTVGETTGTYYRITATAIRPEDGRTTAKIVADVMVGGGATYIVSWQISN
jgi:hypothetical protein